MRLGNYDGVIIPNSKIARIYNKLTFSERHRHRYEINTKYTHLFEKNGLVFSGMSKDKKYMEIAEVPDLKFFIGVQYHPEFQSSIFKPHPIFESFIKESYRF